MQGETKDERNQNQKCKVKGIMEAVGTVMTLCTAVISDIKVETKELILDKGIAVVNVKEDMVVAVVLVEVVLRSQPSLRVRLSKCCPTIFVFRLLRIMDRFSFIG
jgi:hypothetical protein